MGEMLEVEGLLDATSVDYSLARPCNLSDLSTYLCTGKEHLGVEGEGFGMVAEGRERKEVVLGRMMGLETVVVRVMATVEIGEALGKVFDCLQVGEVARGLIFALMLQGLRTVTQ